MYQKFQDIVAAAQQRSSKRVIAIAAAADEKMVHVAKTVTDMELCDVILVGDEDVLDVLLAEQGVCIGRQVGGQYLFDPDSAMPRDEFLAMCMDLTGTETLQGVLSTGFGDDAQIPAWSKAYVATALMNGDVCGCSDGTSITFEARRGITAAEAAVMLSSFLRPSPAAALTRTDVPAWACAAWMWMIWGSPLSPATNAPRRAIR